MLSSEEVVTRLEGTRKLWKVCRQCLVGIIKSVTGKRLVAIAPIAIDTTLREVLRNCPVETEVVSRKIADDVRWSVIRQRKLIKIRPDGRSHSHGRADNIRRWTLLPG